MRTHGCVVVLGVVGLVVACNRHPVGPAADAGERPASGLDTVPVASSAAAADAAAPIGAAGGIFRGAGAQIVVPPGALTKDTAFGITRVTGDALADWPRGTKLGFAFEPAIRVRGSSTSSATCTSGPRTRRDTSAAATTSTPG